MVAETSCRYFRELGFPEPIETGLVVDKVGRRRSSTGSASSRATGDEAAAEGRFVHVYVDNTDPARPGRPRSPTRSGPPWSLCCALTADADGACGTSRVVRSQAALGPREDPTVLLIGLAMLVILVVSGLVVAYVAFPHRGEEIPGAPWLGDAMNKATDALPTLDEDEGTDAERR